MELSTEKSTLILNIIDLIMKRIILALILTISFSCESQSKKTHIVSNEELNYVLSNIYIEKIERKELFNAEAYLTIFEIADSKITKDNAFPETDEILSSYYITVIPDGDYYITSKLFKIEGLINPKIITINEGGFPEFSLTIEHGLFNKRVKENFKFKIK